MGNKCLQRSALCWYLPSHSSWMWSGSARGTHENTRSGVSSVAALPALVRYEAHLTTSPWGQRGHGQNAIHAHGQFGLCPKGLVVCQTFGTCAVNLCQDLRLYESCHLISGSSAASIENWAVASLWNCIGHLWKVCKRSSLCFNGHYQQHSWWFYSVGNCVWNGQRNAQFWGHSGRDFL